MKVILCLSLLLVAMVSLTLASRDDSLQVFAQLKAKKRSKIFGATNPVADLQNALLLSQEDYIHSSIGSESSLLERLYGSSAQNSGPECVQFIRQKAGIMMNLAGISYSTCLGKVDDAVFEKLTEVTNGKVTREQYNAANVLDAFRGQNIFANPGAIQSKLQSRMNGGQAPTISDEMTAQFNEFYGTVKTNFAKCMDSAMALLQDTLRVTDQQVTDVCAGKLATSGQA